MDVTLPSHTVIKLMTEQSEHQEFWLGSEARRHMLAQRKEELREAERGQM